MVAQVAGRAVFYNQSAFDGNDAAASALDDAAVAVDKRALLPGQTATIANYTSYSRGINGIMIDLVDLPPGAAVDAADFRFRVGNDNDPGTWTAAPPPSSISVRPNADGTDRVTLIWPDSAIQNKWLQVTVLATGDTGLGAADVFYFGNAVGESGDSAGDARVTAADVLLTRGNPRTFIDPAPINFAYDFNRDARVNAVDMLLARNNQTTAETALWLITVPSAKGAKSLGWAPPSKSGAARGASRTKAAARDASAPLDWLSEYDRRVTKRASCVAVGVARQAVDRVLAEH
jgi:hypothetical protein